MTQPTSDAPRMDYPAAARSIALNLHAFCDESLPYPEMIADAARKASARFQALEAALGEIVDLSDRQVSPYRPLIALAEIYGRRLDAIRSIARRALAAGGECE